MTPHSNRKALKRLWLELQRPMAFRELRVRDIAAALARAEAVVVNADAPISTVGRCYRCERPMGKAYPIGDRLYGEKCARKIQSQEQA